MSAPECVGVLSGDIVRSTTNEKDRRIVILRLKSAFEASDAYLRGRNCRLYSSDIYRGDAFQCALTGPGWSFWAAIFIRTELLKLRREGVRADVRLGMGLGAVSSWNVRKISASDGEAFRLSGKALDALKSGKDKYRRLRIISPWQDDIGLFSALGALSDAFMQRWTPEQAAALSLFLRDESQQEISRALEIKQPAVQQRLQTAGHFAVKEALDLFRQIVESHSIKPQVNTRPGLD